MRSDRTGKISSFLEVFGQGPYSLCPSDVYVTFLRQVSGKDYLIQMSMYRLPCGDSEIT